MTTKLINFLRISFPFLLTVALWRLSGNFWNPAGILAIIPIFFCSFVRPVNWFGLFSVFMCFVIDYKFETVCFWLAMYCLFYAINSFQNIIDITRIEANGFIAFFVFLTINVLYRQLLVLPALQIIKRTLILPKSLITARLLTLYI